jgi:pimeloyl-ACP methyl ester carboxylesterase
MIQLRKYGKKPYKAAVIHGGPGGAGGMEPVARELSTKFGILEPIQNKKTIAGQVEELKRTIENEIEEPIVLIGHSWGAWLSFIFASVCKKYVKKLIMVGAGPFDESYVPLISENRIKRLMPVEKTEYLELLKLLNNGKSQNKDNDFSRLGDLAAGADAYELLPELPEATPARLLTENPGEIYSTIWPEAAEMRKSGKLLSFGQRIECPVIAIHGECDSHPQTGVSEPLSKELDIFKMIILEKCGHIPWFEKYASKTFYKILENQIQE